MIKKNKNPENQKFFWDECDIEERVTKFVTCVDRDTAVCCSCPFAKPLEDCEEKERPKQYYRYKSKDLRLW